MQFDQSSARRSNGLVALLGVLVMRLGLLFAPGGAVAETLEHSNLVYTQNLLTAMGCYHGTVNGVLGPATISALANCLHRIGGHVPGTPDDLRHLTMVGTMMQEKGVSLPEAMAQLPQTDEMFRLQQSAITARAGGMFPDAVDDLTRALAIADRLLGPGSRDTLSIKAELGATVIWNGDVANGERLLSEAYQDQVTLFGAGSVEALSNLHTQAMFQGKGDQVDLATAQLRQVFEGYAVLFGEKDPETLMAMLDYGNGLMAGFHFDAALAIFQDLLGRASALGANGRELAAEVLISQSNTHDAMGQSALAEADARGALSRIPGGKLKDPNLKVRAQLLLTQALADQKRAPEARALLETIHKTAPDAQQRDLKTMLSEVEWNVLMAEGRGADAALLAGQINRDAVTEGTEWDSDAMLSLAQLARAQHLSHDRQASLATYAHLLALAPAYQIHRPNPTADLTWRERDALADDLRLLSEPGTSDPAAAAEALKVQEWWTFGAVQTTLSDLSARWSAGDPDVAAQVRQYQDLRDQRQLLQSAYVSAATAGTATTARRQAMAAKLADFDSQISAQAAALAKSGTSLADLVAVPVVDPATLQAALHPGEALAAFAVTDDRLYAWLIRPDRIEWHVTEISSADLLRMVRTLRAAVDLSASVMPPPGQGCALTSDVPYLAERPFDLCLAGKIYDTALGAFDLTGIDSLMVVPDGPLSALPFSLLVSGKTATGAPVWLIDRMALSTLPSTTSLISLRNRTSATAPQGSFLGVAPGEFSGLRPDDPLSVAPPPLPGTLTEVQRVAALYGADHQTLIEHGAATEAYVQSADLSTFGTISFSTHALTAEEARYWTKGRVVQSALLLYGGGAAGEDGVLTAGEAAELRLNADWVILSGCNTAASGEGDQRDLSGLARSFLFAGARSLLVSQWSVQDQAAQELIVRTVQESHGSAAVGKAQALRRAILALKAQTVAAHPFFWAPFELVGDGAGPANGMVVAALSDSPAPMEAVQTRGLDTLPALRGSSVRPGTLTTVAALTASEANEQALNLPRADRAEVQARLTALGATGLGHDGNLDAASRDALKAWQTNAGLVATGFLNAAQLAKLRSDSQAPYDLWKAHQPKPKPKKAKPPRHCTNLLIVILCNR